MTRSGSLARRLSAERIRRSERRSSLKAAKQKRDLQHAVVGMLTVTLPEDSPEAKLDDRIVEDAPKDEALLQKSLSGLVLFEEKDTAAIKDLIQAMSVFAFKDNEEVVRQGDLGGTYFFIVAQGQFEIVKDGNVVAEIGPGATFGESVLLIAFCLV